MAKLTFFLGHNWSLQKITFLSSPIVGKHSPLPLTEVSASEVPATLNKFLWKEATSVASILTCASPGRVSVKSFSPIRHWRQGEKPKTAFAFFTWSTKCAFPSNYSLHCLHCYHFRSFRACLAQNNTAQQQP